MGSEGRGEQTVRTDQDNGLLLADEVPEADLAAFREAFSGALEAFGFPPCPGNVMVRNPVWSQPLEGLSAQLKAWVLSARCRRSHEHRHLLRCDRRGRPCRPARRAKDALIELHARRDRAAGAVRQPDRDASRPRRSGVLSTIMASVGVGSDGIDIKKAGTFPIVHGMRTLAIDKGILGRSDRGADRGPGRAGSLEPTFGRELISALHVFMELRLRAQLEALRRGTTEAESIVRLGDLTTVDRDILRDALRIVRQFREMIRSRYNLGAF